MITNVIFNTILVIVCGVLAAFLCMAFFIILFEWTDKPHQKIVSRTCLFFLLLMIVAFFYSTDLLDEARVKERQEKYPEKKLSVIYEDVYDGTGIEIVKDNETGMLYLTKGDAITPLLDANGNPLQDDDTEGVKKAVEKVGKK